MRVLLIYTDCIARAANVLASTKGYRMYVAGPKRLSPFRFSTKCTYHPLPSLAGTLSIHELHSLCVKNKIDIIIPVDIKSMYMLIPLEKQLPCKLVVHDSLAKLQLLNNKCTFYRWLINHSFPTPQTTCIPSADEIDARQLSYPLMVKPLEGEGSAGVRRFDTAATLHHYLNTYTSFPLIAQSFVEGIDMGVSVLADSGTIVAYSVQRHGNNGALLMERNDEAIALVRNMVTALSYTGFAHFDLRCRSSDGTILVLECNPRLWGSIPATYHSGVDMMQCAIQTTCRLPVTRTPLQLGYFVPTSSLLMAARSMHISYFSKATRDNVVSVLCDPLPFLLIWLGLYS